MFRPDPVRAACSALTTFGLPFASLRMEPAFMILSESAAFAIDMAMRAGSSVQAVPPPALIRNLRDAGQLV